MKKTLLATVLLSALVLVWCNCNCNKYTEEGLNDAMQYCLDNWWTHSLIHSQTAVYGECSFPSWVICDDDILWTDECYFLPNLDGIDTEEERMAWCEENVQWWFQDILTDAELADVQRWNEQEIRDEEWNLTIISREFSAKYNKDWYHWTLPWLCEANFVDWSIWTSYGQEFIDE